MINNSIIPYKSQQIRPQLAGFWSWAKKAVAVVGQVAAVFVPLPIALLIIDFTNGDGSFGGYNFGNAFGRPGAWGGANVLPDLPLSVDEEHVLDVWLDNYHAPKMKRLLGRIHNVKQNFNHNTAVSMYNETKEFVGYLKWFTENANQVRQEGLTTNGVQSRVYFLLVQIELLETVLADFILVTGFFAVPKEVTFKGDIQRYRDSGLMTGSAFTFKALQIPTSSGSLNPSVGITPSVPGPTIGITPSVPGSTIGVTPSVPNPTITNPTVDNPEDDIEQSSKSGAKGVLLLIAGVAVGAIIYNSNKTKSKLGKKP